MSRDLSTYSPEFQAFVRSICSQGECNEEAERNGSRITSGVAPSCQSEGEENTGAGIRDSAGWRQPDGMAGEHAPEIPQADHASARNILFQELPRSSGSSLILTEFPQHPAEAAEREGSDGCKDGLADDGQARLSCTGKRTASHGSDAGIDRAGKGVALAAALHPASAKCQQSDAVVSGGSQNRASEYPISPADSSQNFSSELFTALVSAGGVL